MVALNTPLSVRLSEEDALFLAGLELEGAITASDKVRGLIRQARRRAETPAGWDAALAAAHDIAAPALKALRAAELASDRHSTVALALTTAVEEMLAVLLAAPAELAGASPEALARHEARLVDCAARLTEQMLRWGVTPSAPAYDPTIVSRRVAALGELTRLITATADRPTNA
ncbi:hypothetical protein DDF65_10660 [Caulobacter radicis]|uniref:Uncharacterized protein n=1 Tax=Caulobacter radicis TaxID=2172650 RepID=A0A2T9JGI4_9CAUL|nr:hypothetical protein DDF65_10660 [Caulobacter radicis]